MTTLTLREGDTFIKLGQAIKKTGIALSGAEAARLIEEGNVFVNGEEERRRGRKIKAGDIITCREETITVNA